MLSTKRFTQSVLIAGLLLSISSTTVHATDNDFVAHPKIQLVNDATEEIGKDYVYDIDGKINSLTPKNQITNKFTFSDKLEPVLSFKDIKVYDTTPKTTTEKSKEDNEEDGSIDTLLDITKLGTIHFDEKTNTVSWETNDKNLKSLFNHTIKVKITANIKADADLKPYMKDDQVKIPNKADYIYNGDQIDESNVPTVTPTKPDLPIKKQIEQGGKLVDQANELAGASYAYDISGVVQNVTKSGAAVDSFTITDPLDKSLVFEKLTVIDTTVGKEVTVDGKISQDKESNTIKWTSSNVKSILGHNLTTKMTVHIKEDIDLSKITNKDGGLKIPNTVTYDYNGDSDKSNTPNVTPTKVVKPTQSFPKTGTDKPSLLDKIKQVFNNMF